MGEMRQAGQTKGNSPLGRPRRRWDDTIKINVMETVLEGGRSGENVAFIWFRTGTGEGLL
jgi:hypothetical protein